MKPHHLIAVQALRESEGLTDKQLRELAIRYIRWFSNEDPTFNPQTFLEAADMKTVFEDLVESESTGQVIVNLAKTVRKETR
jgi:hypothetical protein